MIELAKDLLKKHEGYRRTPYRDTEGILTVGYGRNLEHNGISKGEAEFLLENDMRQAIDNLRARFPWYPGLDDVRRAVLVNMTVNMGLVRLLGFHRFLRALEEGDYGRAAIEMLDSKWARQVGGRARELADLMRVGDA